MLEGEPNNRQPNLSLSRSNGCTWLLRQDIRVAFGKNFGFDTKVLRRVQVEALAAI
jgi:hypothetical protein